MRRGRRIVALLATIALLGCGGSTDTAHDAIARALAAKPHRLAVVFWPELSGCASCDQRISAVISEWQEAPNAELAVVTVIREGSRLHDPWLPGSIVLLNARDYERSTAGAPRPRIELRGADGALLLSRSVPNYGSQAELLTEEMLAARSFTAPVAMTAPIGRGLR